MTRHAATSTGIARAALIVSAGSIASRVLGLVREQIVAGLFGRNSATDAFSAANRVPITLYDQLVGGLISAALVPVLTTELERDEESFWDLTGQLVSVVGLVLAVASALLAIATGVVGSVFWPRFDPQTSALASLLLQIMAPGLMLLGLSGVATGILQSRRQFVAPAFAAAVFNLALVAVAFLLRGQGVPALAFGFLAGAAAQFALQVAALRGKGIRLTLRWNHPALQRIGVLALPVAAGLVVSSIGVTVDTNLASGLEPGDLTGMRFATTLTQLALGLVATAIGSAFLPELSRRANDGGDGFLAALGAALRAVLFFILPLTLGLLAFREPVIRLLFERGAFGPADTARTALAFAFYSPSIPAAAIDQILIYAFYARQDTLRPALVGVLAVLLYIVIAITLVAPLGIVGLVVANSAQWGSHMLVMAVLAFVMFKGARAGAVLAPVIRLGVAAVVAYALWTGGLAFVPAGAPLLVEYAGLAVLAAVGGLAYLAVLGLLRAPEMAYAHVILRRFRRR